MIRWICDHTKLDKIRNEVIRSKIGVVFIEDCVFGHIRRSMDAPVRRGETIVYLDHRRHRGRLRRSWKEVIRHDLKTLRLVEDMAHDRKLWRARIKVTDS